MEQFTAQRVEIDLIQGLKLVCEHGQELGYRNELYIGVERDGSWLQDLAVIKHKHKDSFDIFVYGDSNSEDYTHTFNVPVHKDEDKMHEAKKLINDFCISEYGEPADFSDLRNIGIAHTTVTDDEIPVQTNVDLVSFRMEQYLCNTLVGAWQYESLKELIDNELAYLDFDSLVSIEEYQLKIFENNENLCVRCE